MKSVITDPSLDHIDKKLFVWLLSTVFAGLVLGMAFSSYEEKAWRSNRCRTLRSARMALRPLRKRTTCVVH